MKRYMKPHDAGSAVRWFFILFSVNTLVLAASLLILEAIIVSPLADHLPKERGPREPQKRNMVGIPELAPLRRGFFLRRTSRTFRPPSV